MIRKFFLAACAALFVSQAYAQTPGQGGEQNPPAGGTPVGHSVSITTPLTPGDFIAAQTATTIADAAIACASLGYCTLPVGLNITKALNFGVSPGTPNGPANALIWATVQAQGTCALSSGSICYFSSYTIGDKVDASPNGSATIFGFAETQQTGSKGGRTVGSFQYTYSASADVGQQYTALGTFAQSAANAGGSPGSEHGTLFGFNPYCRFQNGATNWVQCVGIETDMSLRTGATALDMIGHQVVQDTLSVVAGSRSNIAYSSNGQASLSTLAGWDYLFADGAYSGFPSINATGRVFGCFPHANSGNCGTIGYGIDLSKYAAITNYALLGPQSNGFIDGSFNVKSANLPLGNGSLVINGDMVIDQVHEGASANVGGGGFLLDRWRFLTSDNAQFQSQRVTDAPSGYVNSLQLTVNSAVTPTAGQQSLMQTGIEASALAALGFGAGGAKTIMFDFCAKSSLATTYGVGVQNAATTRNYIVTYTLSAANTWQCFSNVIPGDTAGTWPTGPNAIGMLLKFDLGSGSNFQGTAGAWQGGNLFTTAGATQLSTNNGATLQLSAIHIYASPFAQPYLSRSYAQELAEARRFYRKSFPAGTAPAQSAGVAGCISIKNPIAAGDPSVMVAFDPPMETNPTVVTYNPSANNANWRDITAGADATVSVDPGSSKSMTGVLIATSGTVANLGDILCIHYTADTGN